MYSLCIGGDIMNVAHQSQVHENSLRNGVGGSRTVTVA